jgi:hypothetical protein
MSVSRLAVITSPAASSDVPHDEGIVTGADGPAASEPSPGQANTDSTNTDPVTRIGSRGRTG